MQVSKAILLVQSDEKQGPEPTEEFILDDPGRIDIPDKYPSRTVMMRFVHKGRKPLPEFRGGDFGE